MAASVGDYLPVGAEMRSSNAFGVRLAFYWVELASQSTQGSVAADINVRILRKWSLTMLRFCTMPLQDALRLYETCGNRDFQLVVDSPRGGKRATWAFYQEPYTEFLLFTEMLKKVLNLSIFPFLKICS